MSVEQEHRNMSDADELGGEPAELQDSTNGSKLNTVRDTLATGVCIAAMVLGGVVCLAVNFHWL
jgi:hypothetical protein